MVDQATAPPAVTVWQIDLVPADGQRDRIAEELAAEAQDIGLAIDLDVCASRGFLLQGDLEQERVKEIAQQLLAEPVVEEFQIASSEANTAQPTGTVYVLPKPGVTDAQAETALSAMQALGFPVEAVRTFRKFQFQNQTSEQLQQLASKLLFNDAIEQVVFGALPIENLLTQQPYDFKLQIVSLLDANDDDLNRISSEGGLSLTLVEMQTIQQHFQTLDRDPTDIELETIAQTWSEHCSHKTLAGKIEFSDGSQTLHFDNMLKETIFAATQTIRKDLADNDWCVSVFKDNAGIVEFDDESCITFKVETHNRPSALEPYGGANTGIGGVIRDTLGTGMGAKPICNTDVFCFAPPETPAESLPPGVLHPRRIMKGVVSGVRDYGNRMGIPTVNGAVYFDERYAGNPLVFCGNVGLIPNNMAFKEPQPGDLIVTVGGQTGRDGIHGATFSSAELTEHSEVTSGGSVQIGNAITEKMVTDVLLQARDQNLYTAITDCGAGGFSSAVGEMGEELGAVVWLEKAPLKYQGLSYTEIWISEAQERMVVAVPEKHWQTFEKLCRDESVEATVIGKFEATGKLKLTFNDQQVGELEMSFLHDGRPQVVRQANWQSEPAAPISTPAETVDVNAVLLDILGSPNVASKHWIIRQYDHEVLGGSVIKPLVGIHNDGPSDAAVIRPKLKSRRGIAISCGMNPHFGDFDPYHMAQSSIDEAIRNCVAVGADPNRIAILDNFCWGYTDRPETLGSLVRAALGCHDLAIDLKTPFVSGKDSLNNEFSYSDAAGNRQTITIPSTLLISALGQVPEVDRCVTMDLKQAGNAIYLVGITDPTEMGGSHFNLVTQRTGGDVPKVDSALANAIFGKIHQSINHRWIRSCHDLSEGGLAAAAAEMALAGGLGLALDLSPAMAHSAAHARTHDVPPLANMLGQLFAESNTRFLCEIPNESAAEFENLFGNQAVCLGSVSDSQHVEIKCGDYKISLPIADIKQAWQKPLDWN
ncbi:MAG: phosphoribosylformylglycinamidine synthase subunit PurL [Planctomycetaceae bacterium]|nr:phosphoribosylformylglycinamidine synthase subunit PurL [Planctomycetaceae bacterium]